MTKPKFANKMIIILAGYEKDMNRLLSANEGLNSRFADEIIFPALNPKDSLLVLQGALEKENIVIESLKDISNHQAFLNMIAELSILPAWGNARDMITLAKSMIRASYQLTTDPTPNSPNIILPYGEALACIQRMIDSKKDRATMQGQPKFDSSTHSPVMSMTQKPPTPSTMAINTATSVKTKTKVKKEQPSMAAQEQPGIFNDGVARDPGVSDAVWAQLQRDQRAAEEEAERYVVEMRKKQEEVEALREAERKAKEEAMREIKAKHEAERQEQLRLREEARLRVLKAKIERQRIEKERERRILEQAERKKKDAQARAKLSQMGVCEAGFLWIKQSGGYRCAGGYHFVSDGQLGM